MAGGIGGCYCQELNMALTRGGLLVRVPGVRCGVCVEEIVSAKNQLVRENNELRERLLQERQAHLAELARVQKILDGLSGRVVSQSELLSKKAEK